MKLANAIQQEPFDLNEFRAPAAQFSPVAFWKWNADPSRDVIVAQFDDLHAHGVDAVCIHPMPSSFRSFHFGQGMEIEYLGDEFFQWITWTCARARELGMVVWLYDEGGWPSGSAAGKVLHDRPEFQSKVLLRQADTSFAVQKFEGSPDRPPVDRLNPKATQRFIELTHERYRKAVGEDFGSVIRWVFTDEAFFPGALGTEVLPWYDELPEDFARMTGEELTDDLLAGLFESDPMSLSDRQRIARVNFMRCASARLVDSYLRPIAQWCTRHKLLLGGHPPGLGHPLAALLYGFGDGSQFLDAMQVPGVDTIWRLVFPKRPPLQSSKEASSSAHRQNRARAITESFAVYGQGLTLEQMKWVTDFQFVRGINLMIFSDYPLSTHGPRMCATRDLLCKVNPLWHHFRLWADYTRRLAYVGTWGKPAIDVAVLDISAGLWAGPATEVQEANSLLVATLLEKQVDFDCLPGAGLVAQSSVSPEGLMTVGHMQYSSIVAARFSYLCASTWARLHQFVLAGGHFLVESGTGRLLLKPHGFAVEADPLWERIAADASGTFNLGKGRVTLGKLSDLVTQLDPLVKHEESAPWLRVMKRKHDAQAVYFLVNEDGEPHAGNFTFFEAQPPKGLDLETGKTFGVDFCLHENERCVVALEFPRYGSRVLLFDAQPSPTFVHAASLVGNAIALTDRWESKRLFSHEIKSDNIVVHQIDECWRPLQLGDWRSVFGKWFSGEVAYRISFPGNLLPECDYVVLDLGEVHYAVEIWLNGVFVDSRAWAPFVVQLQRDVFVETNELELRVKNTLANVMLSPELRRDWASRQEPGYRNPYDDRAVEFEQESLASGLIGPVRLLPVCAQDTHKD